MGRAFDAAKRPEVKDRFDAGSSERGAGTLLIVGAGCGEMMWFRYRSLPGNISTKPTTGPSRP
ncbi:MAG: hypothetical protein ACI89G_001242 [Minisyncoccia bacterium]|jgi:hypothetical protein